MTRGWQATLPVKRKVLYQQKKYMIKRIITVAITVAVFSAVSVGAFAGEIKPYNEVALQEATAAGKTILLDFHADWCPVCRNMTTRY
jgi:thiol:disulfide interchange protein